MRLLTFIFIVLITLACSSSSTDNNTEANGDAVKDTVYVVDTIQQLVAPDSGLTAEEENFEVYFQKHEVEGAFLLFDPQDNRFYAYNEPRTKERFRPASTFKILNSLIALETGVIADTNVVLKWDGIERSVPNWNKDQNMREAFRNSTVWFYQELARRVGNKRMQHYVSKSNYGNENIGGKIDDFWLNGDLRISMEEQITLLRKLYQNKLPFSKSTQEKVKGIMTYLESDKYKVYAKTGWASDQKIGWFVGYVIHDYEEIIPPVIVEQDTIKTATTKHILKGYYFATNIDIEKESDAAAREAVTIDILKSLMII